MKINTHGLACELIIGDPDNEDWRVIKISVNVPEISYNFSCTMQTFDLKDLKNKLIKLESGKSTEIEWTNLEENILFKLNQNSLGNIEGSYKFSSNTISVGPTLSGPFAADQSYLMSWVSQLNSEVELGS